MAPVAKLANWTATDRAAERMSQKVEKEGRKSTERRSKEEMQETGKGETPLTPTKIFIHKLKKSYISASGLRTSLTPTSMMAALGIAYFYDGCIRYCLPVLMLEVRKVSLIYIVCHTASITSLESACLEL